jgi:23S rRNA (adenine-N6)-dimethyltransferase
MKRLADYSQHFLRSPALIKELVGHSAIKRTDTVYDIGAGSGAITAVLAAKAARVVAIEYEPRMAEKLRDNMARYDNVTVVEGDFLKLPLSKESHFVFSNIPFHISADIIRRLVFEDTGLRGAYLIVQKQFAQKLLIERSPFTGQLGAAIAPWVSVRIRRPLKRTDYWPHPNVDTVLIELVPRSTPLVSVAMREAYVSMITESYHDPTKFKRLALKEAGIAAGVRPSQLSIAQWLLLFSLRNSKEP